MFNTKSDDVINKLDPDAIVCRSVSGEIVRITREDFASDGNLKSGSHGPTRTTIRLSDATGHTTTVERRLYPRGASR